MSDKKIMGLIEDIESKTMGITSSPSTTLEVRLDIINESQTSRALGQMVFVPQEEDSKQIVLLGQIVEVTTKNRWHEDPSFKGVIKNHGWLPNLSHVADNRLATLSVQSSFDCSGTDSVIHILGISPSTGQKVQKMNNDVMQILVRSHAPAISYIGHVYGSDVDLPMWFKHFGEDEKIPSLGAKDAYHIGVFGKTGSGKTVATAMLLLAYAKAKDSMNILVLDPQEQFSNDIDLLPNGRNFREEIQKLGMRYELCNLVEDIALPGDDLQLFGDLLVSNGFIEKAFGPFYNNHEKIDLMRNSVIKFLEGKSKKSKFYLSTIADDSMAILSRMVDRFLENEEKYIKSVYGTTPTQDKLKNSIHLFKQKIEDNRSPVDMWHRVAQLFSKKIRGQPKMTIDELAKKIIAKEGGTIIILNLAFHSDMYDNDNLQALFLQLVEKSIVQRGSNFYIESKRSDTKSEQSDTQNEQSDTQSEQSDAQGKRVKGKRANCLVVMDEAHRFVSSNSPDMRVRELTKAIVDSVRTTRKYGIGHMFITQSLESMDDEIIKQMRIFAFGHGLTIGTELRKIGEIINNPASVDLYRSFIDPANNGRYPFMFFGPVSPLSATGAPLFVEIYNKYEDFINKNKDK